MQLPVSWPSFFPKGIDPAPALCFILGVYQGGAAMYNIYLITDVENKDFAALDPFMRFLPSETRETALRFRRSIDRKNCILSYFLLQYALFKNYGICAFTNRAI